MPVAIPLIIAAAATLHLLCIVESFLLIDGRWPEVSVLFLTASISVPSTRHPDDAIIHLLDSLKLLSKAAVKVLPKWLFHCFSSFGNRVFEEYARTQVTTEADACLCCLLLVERQRWVG
jgi:hypothetical protein